MNLLNHLTGGTVFTAFFGSLFFGINILASPFTIGVTLIASILPDIDHTKSWIGKCCLPLSRFLNRRYGHRTLTHGLPCMMVVIVVCSLLEGIYFEELIYSTIVGLGYLSHLVFDMCTLQGVPALYPFNKSPFILIGNPEHRIRSGDYRGEAIAFSVFLMWGVTSYSSGFIEKGFWTTYNQAFATLQHLNSEFRRADHLLRVHYQYKIGTEVVEGYANCIESYETKTVLLHDDGQWLTLDEYKMTILLTRPVPTDLQFGFETVSFINITADSLNWLCAAHDIRTIDLVANQAFTVNSNGVGERTDQFKAHYVSDILFQVDQTIAQESTITFQPNPRIATLKQRLQLLKSSYNKELQDYEFQQSEILRLQSEMQSASDLFTKETLQKRIRELRKASLPEYPEMKVRELEVQVQELEKGDWQRMEEKLRTAHDQPLNQNDGKAYFTGVLQCVQVFE